MKIKLGFDIHGVLDTYGNKYRQFIDSLDRDKFEIHIITGVKEERGLIDNPELVNLCYDGWFSIHSECERLGEKITFDDKGRPWVDPKTWDAQKALYCDREGIFALFDDSPTYHKYFTNECLYFRQMNNHDSRNNWRHRE